MRRERRRAGLVVLALLAGCDDSGSGGRAPDGWLPPGQDAGPDAALCPPGTYRQADGCAPLPADVCALVDEVTKDCQDRDGDCFVVGCARGPAELTDCDDARADVYPGAPEVCDGVDNDCDGALDEGLGLGAACGVCGVAGQRECSVGRPGAVACSAAQGQSAAAAGGPERCNGLDDDCDDVVDEACRVDAATADRRSPVLCGDAVLLVEDGRLVRRYLDGRAEEEVAPPPVAYPACDGDLAAWLVPDGPCVTPADGPLRCPGARLLAREGDEMPMDLSGLADLGPPRVAAGRVYGHVVLGAGPVLQRWAPAVEPLFGGASASDPSAVVAGRVAVRQWAGGAPQVEVRGLDGEAGVRVDAAPGVAGPPALDADWVAWIVDAEPPAVWAVPLARPRAGFQVTAGGWPVGRPWLDAGWLVWLDTDGLRGLALASGAAVAVPGPREAEAVDVRDGRVAWLDDGQLYVAELAGGGPAEPYQRPADGGVRDAGTADAGTADAGPADAGPADAAPADAAP